MDWFLLTCLLFVFGTLLEFAFVAYRQKLLADSLPKNKQTAMKLREKMKSSLTFTEDEKDESDDCELNEIKKVRNCHTE